MVLQNMHTIEIERAYLKVAYPILVTKNARMMDTYIQHGKTSCLNHSIAVAYYSLVIVNALNIRCDKESLIRGALLHDYFLYDWHKKGRAHSLHGFKHPQTALENALLDYALNPVERDIIIRHMFPLVPIPPRYIESMVVCVVDKLCSIKEMLCPDPYSKTLHEIMTIGMRDVKL